jgi:hypothetical protein
MLTVSWNEQVISSDNVTGMLSTGNLAQAVTLLTYILEVPCSNLGRTPTVLIEGLLVSLGIY